MNAPTQKPYTILLVEDHTDSRMMMETLLKLDGFIVFAAPTGARAVSLARDVHPDLILMDLSLPDFDGITATKMIRANPASRLVPIIALTAYDMNEFRDRAMAAGCNDFMLKPVDFEKLESTIKSWLSGSAAIIAGRSAASFKGTLASRHRTISPPKHR